MNPTSCLRLALSAFLVVACAAAASAAPVYLNDQNTIVSLGPTMAPEPFANRNAADSLASIIDAPSAAASELHNQLTHVWVSGGVLEIVFDFQAEYDLTTLHFWNYHSESFDVDDIAFTFFDALNNQVGTLSVAPALGGSGGSDSNPIFAEDISLSFPSKVRFVNAVLSGSNNEVDFNNLGFTGELTAPRAVPEPASATLLMLVGFTALMMRRGSACAPLLRTASVRNQASRDQNDVY